ncbi:MAG: lysine--tRNA ligase [Verrucomicrobiota bacterium]
MSEETSELLQLRRDKIQTWKDLGIDPFGKSFENVETSSSIVANYVEEKQVRAAGRLVSLREMGKSLFGHILDGTGRIQIYAKKETLGDSFDHFKRFDLGDFIGVEGNLFTSKSGEKTIKVTRVEMLSKALRPMPSKWHGLSDVEQRYRQRYLDLMSNPVVRRTLTQRSQVVREIRSFLENKGFMEVETPMMQSVPGGAAAQPFVTHHNALNIDLYMRIAPELYLKRLLVGGFDKVFEVNRNFRNEGISRKHNPEFTMLECYWAYADFEKMADLVEELITTVAQKVVGSLQVGAPLDMETSWNQEEKKGEPRIDLTRPWPRKRYHDCIKDAAGADWFELTPDQRREKAKSLGLEISPAMEDFEITNQVFEKLVEAKSINPLFVTHLPKELVPLAKQNVENPNLVDVFELIINGQEISPGYSELNDPIVQRERLEHQAGEETQKLDEDFLLALEHGMPPAGGIGIGIDRLVMMLTGAESIRDVILFPLMRPKE